MAPYQASNVRVESKFMHCFDLVYQSHFENLRAGKVNFLITKNLHLVQFNLKIQINICNDNNNNTPPQNRQPCFADLLSVPCLDKQIELDKKGYYISKLNSFPLNWLIHNVLKCTEKLEKQQKYIFVDKRANFPYLVYQS